MARGYMLPAKNIDWETPQDLFDELNAEFDFTLDPCATRENAKCPKYYTKRQNGLIQSWTKERVFMNPSYGREIIAWVEKAYTETQPNFFETATAQVVVGLLPVRTDTKWFHKYIYHKAEIRFIRGRLYFSNVESAAPFPSMILIWRGVE